MALSESLKNQLTDLVQKHRVLLFMKGTRQAPQCGFSAQVVQLLDALDVDYEDVDVLRSPELRDGIKEFSQWPTIPQLFIAGQFVGGCDIVRDMSSSGELQKLLGSDAAAPELPEISITPAALDAFRGALAESGTEPLHLKIDSAFQNDLYFGPREPGDSEVSASGLTLLLDRATLRRAKGLRIDFVTGERGGFKLDNPSAPPSVKQIAAPELAQRLKRGEIALFDVRPESERALASIAGARPLDADGQEYLFGLDRNAPIALHCHHGVRSQNAAQQLIAQGFRNVYNLQGGIDAWSELVDASVPRY